MDLLIQKFESVSKEWDLSQSKLTRGEACYQKDGLIKRLRQALNDPTMTADDICSMISNDIFVNEVLVTHFTKTR